MQKAIEYSSVLNEILEEIGDVTITGFSNQRYGKGGNFDLQMKHWLY